LFYCSVKEVKIALKYETQHNFLADWLYLVYKVIHNLAQGSNCYRD